LGAGHKPGGFHGKKGQKQETVLIGGTVTQTIRKKKSHRTIIVQSQKGDLIRREKKRKTQGEDFPCPSLWYNGGFLSHPRQKASRKMLRREQRENGREEGRSVVC